MKFLKLCFASMWAAIPLVMVYITACAVATFIENDYGTPTARALIYNTWWFDFLHLYLLVVLIGVFLVSKPWKRRKYASILFHSAFIFIILGAGITRYYGIEGSMHLREGMATDFFSSSDSYLNINAQKQGQTEQISLLANLVNGQTLETQATLFHQPLKLQVLSVTKRSLDKKDPSAILKLRLQYENTQSELELIGGIGIQGRLQSLLIGDTTFEISWGTKPIVLPFAIALTRFTLDRYPGSHSPSSYASDVLVLDKTSTGTQTHIMPNASSFPFRIFMNNVLDYGGYRFYQSSYDQDEKGSILSVNKDPGKNFTYLGYFLLILGGIALIFSPNGRFRQLANFLQKQQITILLYALMFLVPQTSLNAQETQEQYSTKEILQNIQSRSQGFAQAFDSVLVQDFGGRIKPISTLATDAIHKITKTNNYKNFSNTQLLIGMMMFPHQFQQFKMIKISNPKLKNILGIPSDERYISFDNLFKDGTYVLQNYVEEANRKKPSMRDMFDKEVLNIDERANVAFSIYSGEILRIFPDTMGSNTWRQPIQAIESAVQNGNTQEARKIATILQKYAQGFGKGVFQNQWNEALEAIAEIKNYQKEYGSDLMISDTKIQYEIFLNEFNFFHHLTLPFILLGLILFGTTIVYILRDRSIPPKLTLFFYSALIILTSITTLALILRWYISNHAPWSNAYESMLYISWASAMSAILFFRKSNLAISAASFMSGISLFVADLGFMDPQIGNLVPVLKSYWLNIHVSIITASYGFLGLCFILGCITLLLFILRSKRYKNIENTILSLHAINEMAMIAGLLLLTIGNFLGGVWANESWGRYWGWDPKETWALISIGVYGIILHLRFLGFKNMPFVFASSSVVGFLSVLMTYFGVNYYLSGMHSYAAGDPIPIPTFVYFFLAGITLLVFLASFKRQLQFPKLP
ncbi:cytochrome C biogenesis protein [Helicobacter enhydrae]|uniref:Cytochrome C biogenesis protein n=1 Tax=Helicobacter enhydrae TaxID=222136 RepID=A0A1B1U6Q0_9HELI|nr:cytochrome c biogenesis protein CcsA [Helicobacter enhydrae]ANV98420.1 cytochrome C biogenesis protein [Helicobacter enhydrae]